MTKKVALVTAASQGIGAACAKALKEDGYHLVVMSRSEKIYDLGKKLDADTVRGSVTKKEDLTNLVDKALSVQGRIDVVVNNTGHPPKGLLPELTDEQWYEGMDLLLLNVIRISRLVLPVMRKQNKGSIINISSFTAFEPNLSHPVSSVLRAALTNYTKLFANQYAEMGIRMNSVLPGYVESYEPDQSTLDRIPMKRPGTLRELADLVVFLASDKSGYITGQNIKMDGGLSRSM